MDSYKKENKDLKEKVNSLQIELTEKEVSKYAWSKENCVSTWLHIVVLLCPDMFLFSAVLYSIFCLQDCTYCVSLAYLDLL